MKIDMYNIFQYKIIRYLTSGGTAAFVDLSILYVLTNFFEVWYLLSVVAAFIVAFFVSFTLQKFWTFKDSETRKLKKQLTLYFITATSMLIVNTALMFILVEKFGFWYLSSQFFVLGGVALFSFIIYSRFIFYPNSNKSKGQKSRNLKKTILIATGLYPPDIGGPATYSKILEDNLPKHGYHVKIASFGGVRKYPRFIRHGIYFLKLLINGSGTHIIYAQDTVSVGFPAMIAAIILRKKFLLKIVGDYAWEQYAQKKSNPDSLQEFQNRSYDLMTEIRRKIQKRVTKQALTVVVPSEYLKTIVLKWGIQEEKIIVIYNTFNRPQINKDKKSLRENFGMEGTVLISVGRLVPWKGFGTLIGLMPDLLKDIPNIKLYIIGDGPEKVNLQELVLEHGLEDRVELVGRLPQDDLLQYIKAGDIFVLNTGYEGFSHVLLEAMALGIPIVATNAGGNTELIEDKKTGLLVNYNNKEELKEAIVTYYKVSTQNDSSELVSIDEIAKNAHRKIKEFSRTRLTNETVAVLKNI